MIKQTDSIQQREVASLMSLATKQMLTLFELKKVTTEETWYEIFLKKKSVGTFSKKEEAYAFLEQCLE